MTYDPNGRYEPVERNGYGVWAVLGIIALFVVVGFIYWGASGNGTNQTASAPVTRSETTGMGGAGSAPPRPAAPATTPAAPASPAPAR
jgi:hypothetical protein